jgi:hypothetical protein
MPSRTPGKCRARPTAIPIFRGLVEQQRHANDPSAAVARQGRLTDAEVEELKQLVARYTDQGGDAIFGSLVQMALNAKEKGQFDQTSYDRTTGNYNQFWMADRDWDNRTSLITDPKDGQMPPLTPEALQRRTSRPRPVVVEGSESRAAAPMVRKIGRCRSAASLTLRRAPAPATTATCRSFNRPRRSSSCRG